MKGILKYLVGILTLLGVVLMLYATSAIYDNGKKLSVHPYFFRMDRAAHPDIPMSLSEVGKKRLLDWLVQKYVVEYFYVVPSVANVKARTEGVWRNPPILRFMSSQNAFNQWRRDVAPEIEKMANDGVRRTVTVFDEIYKPNDSDYWRVEYELKTWRNPNNMEAIPEIERGVVYLDVVGSLELQENVQAIHNALVAGADPAIIFNFLVQGVQVQKEQK